MELQFKYRIKQYKDGFLVEIRKTKNYILFKKHYWEHYISYYGMPTKPYFFNSYKSAKDNFLKQILDNTKIEIYG